jgi:hypothetical protein
MTKSRGAFLLVALVAAVGGVRLVQAGPPAGEPRPEKGIDPKADRMLKKMTDYLASLQRFQVQSTAIDEVVTTSGQKIQVASASLVSVERPNRMRSEQLGAEGGLGFWYDGKTMTLACKVNKTYATAPAPATLDDTIDAARKKFQVEAPGADLLYSHPYDVLTEQVTGGKFIGSETIDGVAANHLAFEGEQVDWQIWIQDGPQPLPLRFVVTTKTMKSQPEFVVQLSHWKPEAKVSDSTFEYRPTQGGTRVQTLPACSVPSGGKG